MEFAYKEGSGLRSQNVIRTASNLEDYIVELRKVLKKTSYDAPETFINLPYDEEVLALLHKLKQKKVKKKIKYLVVVGIGGSNLGAKALYDAIFGFFDVIEPARFPKCLFVDTNDTAFLFKLKGFLGEIKNTDEVLINVVSKSGSTLETLANLEIILSVNKKFQDRLVVTTEYNSDLWFEAEKINIDSLPIPHEIGGRYSVFSSVGLFPLLVLDFDIVELLGGAMHANDICLSQDVEKNVAVMSATVLYLNYIKGKSIHDTFFFHSELESLGKWYRQLLAESLGKRGLGITPTVSIGSTDLHSMAQLYISGPKDKSFSFVWSKERVSKVIIESDLPFSSLVKNVRGKSADDILYAILQGVRETFTENKIPFVDVTLDTISPGELGFYMQYKMFEVLYLGKLLGLNPFDQPDVEQYKQKTREALQE